LAYPNFTKSLKYFFFFINLIKSRTTNKSCIIFSNLLDIWNDVQIVAVHSFIVSYSRVAMTLLRLHLWNIINLFFSFWYKFIKEYWTHWLFLMLKYRTQENQWEGVRLYIRKEQYRTLKCVGYKIIDKMSSQCWNENTKNWVAGYVFKCVFLYFSCYFIYWRKLNMSRSIYQIFGIKATKMDWFFFQLFSSIQLAVTDIFVFLLCCRVFMWNGTKKKIQLNKWNN
jgi:hypothetical protein